MQLGRSASKSSGLRTTPWRRRRNDGVYFGHNNNVWVYFEVPMSPIHWEDNRARLEAGQVVDTILEELGATSADIGGGMQKFAIKRSVHVFSAMFDQYRELPETTKAHGEFLGQVLPVIEPSKTFLIGVRLWTDLWVNMTRGGNNGGNLVAQAKAAFGLTDKADDTIDSYAADLAEVRALMLRNSATVPTENALKQLESWFNLGAGPDAQVLATSSTLRVTGGGDWEISAVTGFTNPVLRAPNAQWILDAMTHADPAVAVSIRAELTPASVIQAQLRASQRKLRAAEEEESRTGDISRDEIGEKSAFAKDLENSVREANYAWMTSASILLAREWNEFNRSNESYADMLGSQYGIETKPLEHRQLEALDEMQPCSTTVSNPFAQTLNPALIAYSGLPGFSNIGDDHGAWIGRVDPDYASVLLDPFAAPANNKPPVMTIFGDPGSGKTFLAQLIATQGALADVQTIMINPKGFDSLKDFVDYSSEYGVPGRVISMQAMEHEGGAFDPFRFAENPMAAAEMLHRHITTVIGQHAGGITMSQEIELGADLNRAADEGARCAGEAMAYVRDPQVSNLVASLVKSSSLFRLGFSMTPKPPFEVGGGLTLIEFDRELPLPDGSKDAGHYERDERIALGAMRLVTRASMEILMRSKGGILIVDEAHHYLGSPEGLSSLQRMGREGRSLRLLPIFLTQRVSDVLKADMENYLSRVFVMKLTDETQAAAALKLCGLKSTPERVAFLRNAGPRKGSEGMPGRGALGFFRDIHDRHSVVMVGPVPEDVRLAFSTNPDDKAKRAAVKAAVAEGTS
jgi:hypothetical protein